MKNGKHESLKLCNVKYLLHTHLLDMVLVEQVFLFHIFKADELKWNNYGLFKGKKISEGL